MNAPQEIGSGGLKQFTGNNDGRGAKKTHRQRSGFVSILRQGVRSLKRSASRKPQTASNHDVIATTFDYVETSSRANTFSTIPSDRAALNSSRLIQQDVLGLHPPPPSAVEKRRRKRTWVSTEVEFENDCMSVVSAITTKQPISLDRFEDLYDADGNRVSSKIILMYMAGVLGGALEDVVSVVRGAVQKAAKDTTCNPACSSVDSYDSKISSPSGMLLFGNNLWCRSDDDGYQDDRPKATGYSQRRGKREKSTDIPRHQSPEDVQRLEQFMEMTRLIDNSLAHHRDKKSATTTARRRGDSGEPGLEIDDTTFMESRDNSILANNCIDETFPWTNIDTPKQTSNTNTDRRQGKTDLVKAYQAEVEVTPELFFAMQKRSHTTDTSTAKSTVSSRAGSMSSSCDPIFDLTMDEAGKTRRTNQPRGQRRRPKRVSWTILRRIVGQAFLKKRSPKTARKEEKIACPSEPSVAKRKTVMEIARSEEEKEVPVTKDDNDYTDYDHHLRHIEERLSLKTPSRLSTTAETYSTATTSCATMDNDENDHIQPSTKESLSTASVSFRETDPKRENEDFRQQFKITVVNLMEEVRTEQRLEMSEHLTTNTFDYRFSPGNPSLYVFRTWRERIRGIQKSPWKYGTPRTLRKQGGRTELLLSNSRNDVTLRARSF
jgi:hypothetical protein